MSNDTQKCIELLARLHIKSSYIEDMTLNLHCDYYGITDTTHVIVEYKTSCSDLERGLMQLLRYYDNFSRIQQYPEDGRLPFYCDKKIPKLPIVLILFYDGVEYLKFEKYHSLYRDYIVNKNCPKIKFCYFNEHNTLTTLE